VHERTSTVGAGSGWHTGPETLRAKVPAWVVGQASAWEALVSCGWTLPPGGTLTEVGDTVKRPELGVSMIAAAAVPLLLMAIEWPVVESAT
jgi:hypothetical protein